jgi:hypothetical protein
MAMSVWLTMSFYVFITSLHHHDSLMGTRFLFGGVGTSVITSVSISMSIVNFNILVYIIVFFLVGIFTSILRPFHRS